MGARALFDEGKSPHLTVPIDRNETEPFPGARAGRLGNSGESLIREGIREGFRPTRGFAVDRIKPGDPKRALDLQSCRFVHAFDGVEERARGGFEGIEKSAFRFVFRKARAWMFENSAGEACRFRGMSSAGKEEGKETFEFGGISHTEPQSELHARKEKGHPRNSDGLIF